MTTKPKAPNPGFVYVLQSLHLYKIGRCKAEWSRNTLFKNISENRWNEREEQFLKSKISKRLSCYKTHNPHGVELIGYKYVRDCVYVEGLFHKKYKKYQVAGEWFNFPGNVLAEVLLVLDML